MAKWYEIRNEIQDTVISDCEDGTLDWRDDEAVSDYAWEYADGSQYVIYTHLSREAWATGADEWEDDAADLGPFDSIQGWVTATVFEAIRATVAETVGFFAEEHAEDDDE